MPRSTVAPGPANERCEPWVRDEYQSFQVNVNAEGCNILGDAANEPSIAIDPTDPDTIVIGWRQFDTVDSSFRQAGIAYSHDAGYSWVFRGSLTPGVFGSDPVLAANADGVFYYLSINFDEMRLFRSFDRGITWDPPIQVLPFLADKPWMAIDRTEGIGRGNIYITWGGRLTLSRDSGSTFVTPIGIPNSLGVGTIAVAPTGEVFVSGVGGSTGINVAVSETLQDSTVAPAFDFAVEIDVDGHVSGWDGPNPGGLLGQVWIATNHSPGPTRGHVYLLASLAPESGDDPLDVMFVRSTDGGRTWSDPVRVNDDSADSNAWQWFGTMSVAPHGRIDVVFNDTRNSGVASMSELFYTYSHDGGVTWAPNVPVSPMFDSHIGWPRQDKLGDYYDMISDNLGVNIAYAATFNGEQDVYYLRIAGLDCNGNGIPDVDDLAEGTSLDCNENKLPDECDPDCNGNGLVDFCEVRDGVTGDCDANYNPDECDPDFDSDGLINGCDSDIDNDGVVNDDDVCPFTPLGTVVEADGSPISDTNSNCDVDLIDYFRFHNCILEGGPGVEAPSMTCRQPFGYDDDLDIDLADFAGFSAAFTGTR